MRSFLRFAVCRRARFLLGQQACFGLHAQLRGVQCFVFQAGARLRLLLDGECRCRPDLGLLSQACLGRYAFLGEFGGLTIYFLSGFCLCGRFPLCCISRLGCGQCLGFAGKAFLRNGLGESFLLRASLRGLHRLFLCALSHACRFDGLFMRSGRGLRSTPGFRLGCDAGGGIFRKAHFRGVSFQCHRFCPLLGLGTCGGLRGGIALRNLARLGGSQGLRFAGDACLRGGLGETFCLQAFSGELNCDVLGVQSRAGIFHCVVCFIGAPTGIARRLSFGLCDRPGFWVPLGCWRSVSFPGVPQSVGSGALQGLYQHTVGAGVCGFPEAGTRSRKGMIRTGSDRRIGGAGRATRPGQPVHRGPLEIIEHLAQCVPRSGMTGRRI